MNDKRAPYNDDWNTLVKARINALRQDKTRILDLQENLLAKILISPTDSAIFDRAIDSIDNEIDYLTITLELDELLTSPLELEEYMETYGKGPQNEQDNN